MANEVENDHDSALKREIEKLRAENAALKSGDKLTLAVAEKGGISFYGLGRFPVTLYREQWTRVLKMAQEIEKFGQENADKLEENQALAKKQQEKEREAKKLAEKQARIKDYIAKVGAL